MTGLQRLLAGGGMMAAALVFMPGCASEKWPEDVPHTASLNSEGNGRLAFTAPSSGMVYVYDDSANRLVYSGQVLSGQRIVVDPKDDRVDVDDKKVSEQKMGTEDRYQVYFDPQGPRVVEHRVVDERIGPPAAPGTTQHRIVEEHRVERVE